MNLFLFQRHSRSHLSFSLDIQIHMLMIRYNIPLMVDSALYTIYFIDVSKMQFFWQLGVDVFNAYQWYAPSCWQKQDETVYMKIENASEHELKLNQVLHEIGRRVFLVKMLKRYKQWLHSWIGDIKKEHTSCTRSVSQALIANDTLKCSEKRRRQPDSYHSSEVFQSVHEIQILNRPRWYTRSHKIAQSTFLPHHHVHYIKPK